MFGQYKCVLYLILLLFVSAPAVYPLELSLSRFTFDTIEEYPIDAQQNLEVIIRASNKELIKNATIVVGIHPFILMDVYSLDPNFQVSHQNDSGILHLHINNVQMNTSTNEEWIKIELSTGREGEKYFSDFGEFPILSAEIMNHQDIMIQNVHIQQGGWIHLGSDVVVHFSSLPVRVFDKQNLSVPNVLVVYELIGRAGIVEGRITDKNGMVDFMHPPEGFYPDTFSPFPPPDNLQLSYDYESFINNSSFVGNYVNPGCFTARFLVFPTAENASFSEPYIFKRTLCHDSDGIFRFAEETLILGETTSRVKSWNLYQ